MHFFYFFLYRLRLRQLNCKNKGELQLLQRKRGATKNKCVSIIYKNKEDYNYNVKSQWKRGATKNNVFQSYARIKKITIIM